MQLLSHLWLQLSESFVQLDLLLQIGLLTIALRYLLVLFIACLKAYVLEVVSEALDREHRRSNLAIAFNAWNRKHINTFFKFNFHSEILCVTILLF